MLRKRLVRGIVFAVLICGAVGAENIDPKDRGAQYAWGENVGWLNFEPAAGGVQVSQGRVTGFVWAENIGWISLSCENTSSCGRVDFGVVNDGNGNLSGFAWGENVGWINFNPRAPGDTGNYGVRIDDAGRFEGWAWGENIGWIRFDATKAYNVRACVVTLEDLANFAEEWLAVGTSPANLYADGSVDMRDFSIFASRWLDFCPDGWRLK
ncbi:MAG TPA: hypothetical protein P5279_00355 [Anaerohalosphaeraceae bacterium]|jgi:hypothetical protein|nr:hypothetical protein [Anaerohalosphaeraceae bacterium]HRT48916.1 hypothetical protein [Anaerohalosphaeraceae bacterium]HRT85039.1 hypothetical protein [Anaerohalosphaeraceae bacterium]